MNRPVGVNVRAVFWTVILSAFFMTLARVLSPFEVGKDQALQLEAAQRLVSGFGLTSTYFAYHPSDISRPPVPGYLTWWPPGFSLIAAALLWTGVPLGIVLRSLYGALTLLGWAGWARLADAALGTPDNHRSGSRLLVAALLPVFFTPSWGGTDIFLWAAASYFTLWLYKSGTSQHPYKLVAWAGLLAGLAFSIRYGAAFLFPAGLLILLQASWPDRVATLRRSLLFSAASAAPVMATLLYIRLVSDTAFLPEYISITARQVDWQSFIGRALSGLPATSTLLVGSPLLEEVARRLPHPAMRQAAGAICFLGVLSLPVVLLRARVAGLHRQNTSVLLPLAILPLFLTLFLIATAYFNISNFDPVGYERYYHPLALCGVLTWCAVAGNRRAASSYRVFAGVMIGMSFAYYCAYLPWKAAVEGDPAGLTRVTLGYTPGRSSSYSSTSLHLDFPSGQVYSLKENSRTRIRELHDRYPAAVFYLQNHAFYVYDAFQLAPELRGLDLRQHPNSPDFWRSASTSKPLTVVWVMNVATFAQIEEQRVRNALLDATVRSGHVVFEDAFEKTTIVVADLPTAGRLPRAD